ncbi:MAG: hypothetical protein LBT76_01205 [Tannerella sp.]|jgi:hypothetical protein|nr:hypothetical protein [Tannerella sp.]
MRLHKFQLIGLLLSINCIFISARDNLRLADVRTLGMGGNGVTHAVLFNPALLAWQDRKDARIDYFNRYSIKELATVSGGFCLPNRILPAGLHIASFGYDEYRESMFRLSVGKQLNDCWALGVSVQYALLQSVIFETDASRLSTDIGASFRPAEYWFLSLSVINFPSVSLNSESVDSERIAAYLIELGVNWQMMDDLLLTGGLAHNREAPLCASMGMEYRPFPDFHLRAGVKTSPFLPSVGAGYAFAGVTVDVVMIYHPILGVSTGIGLSCSF